MQQPEGNIDGDDDGARAKRAKLLNDDVDNIDGGDIDLAFFTAAAPPLTTAGVATAAVISQPKKMYKGRVFDWKITILTPQTFKTFLVIIYRVLTQCPFQLFKSERLTGLRVDSMDASMVCMIKASYECEIETNIDLTRESFAVVTDTFSTLLKDVQPGNILTLTRFAGAAELTVTSYAREHENNRSLCTLSILNQESNAEHLRMQDITYRYMVEMDLAKLKSYCKMAQDINSSYMEFRIEEPAGGSDGDDSLYFTIGAASEVATFQKVHHSSTTTPPDAPDTMRRLDGDDGGDSAVTEIQFFITRPTDAAATTDDADALPLILKYKEIFSTSYLNNVLKNMDRQTVQLYMSAALPLVVKYSLGNDQSHIQVVLAPRIKDDDDGAGGDDAAVVAAAGVNDDVNVE
jgi:hypothetical protein